MNQTIASQTSEHVTDKSAFPDGTPSSTSVYTTGAFWEGLWRKSGITYVALYIVACVIHGYHPGVGASVDALAAFYGGHRTRILIAAVIFGQNVLNLLWFAAALRFILADAKREGWGAAVTASSAAIGVVFFLRITVGAILAYSIAGSGNHLLASGLNDFGWGLAVLSSFPLAMLIMAGSFGLWRAGWSRMPSLRWVSRQSWWSCLAADVGERWILVTRRSLFAVCLADCRSRLGLGREPGSFDAAGCPHRVVKGNEG
jgi:hypothetical protein